MFISESDTRAKLIDPKLKESGWEDYVIREYYFTDGRKLSRGKRGKRLFADYLLRYKNTNLEGRVVEISFCHKLSKWLLLIHHM